MHRSSEEGRLVGEWDTGIDVEHVSTGGHLGEGVGLNPGEVAVLHLLGEELPSGRIDALADHDEGAIESDHDLFRR